MLKLEHISKSFDGVSILKDINLEIGEGEIVSILGPSGSGKTTPRIKKPYRRSLIMIRSVKRRKKKRSIR